MYLHSLMFRPTDRCNYREAFKGTSLDRIQNSFKSVQCQAGRIWVVWVALAMGQHGLGEQGCWAGTGSSCSPGADSAGGNSLEHLGWDLPRAWLCPCQDKTRDGHSFYFFNHKAGKAKWKILTVKIQSQVLNISWQWCLKTCFLVHVTFIRPIS